MGVRDGRVSSRRFDRRRVFLVFAASSLLTVGAATVTSAAALPLHGRAPSIGVRPQPRHGVPFAAEAISCVSARVCLAVGQYSRTSVGEIAEIVNGKQTTSRTVPGTQGITGISCPSRKSECDAIGFAPSPSFAPVVLTVSRTGVPNAVKSVTTGEGNSFNAISCYHSIASCDAVGQTAGGAAVWFLSLHNGQPGTSRTVSVAHGAFIENTAIACLSATRCRAVGSYPSGTGASQQTHGFAITVNSGTPSAAHAAAPFGLNGISCPSPGHCEVAGSNAAGRGFVGTLPANKVTKAHGLKGFSLDAISCPSTTNCTAVGSALVGTVPKAAFTSLARGKPGPVRTVRGAAVLTSVATPTTTFYEALGQLLLGANGSPRLVVSN
jgi:hypothetical protein